MIQTPAPAISSVSNIPIKAAPVTAAMSAVSLSPSAEDSVAVASKSKADTPVIARSTSSISFAAEKTKSELQAGSGGVQASRSLAMRQLGHEAAARAKQNKSDALAARKAQVNAADEAGKLNTTETVSDSGTTNAAPAVVPEDVKIDELSNTELSPVAVGKENVPIATSSYATTGSDIATDRTFTTTKTSSSTASGAIFASSESPLLAPMEETTTNTEHTTSEGLSPQKAEFAISQLVLPSSVHILASQSEITTHRGSTISTANKAEIKAIEEALKIPEEPEEEDQNPKDSNSIPNPDHHIRFAGEDKTEESNRVAAVTARTNSMIGEDSKATKQASSDSIQDKEKDAVTIQTKPETQQEVAADPTRVLESVED